MQTKETAECRIAQRLIGVCKRLHKVLRRIIFRFVDINLPFCFQFIDIFRIAALESAQPLSKRPVNGLGVCVENCVRRSPLLLAL
ncbi:MAG TPA: hypothetical protein DCP40_06210, partial [Stenotrophomonas sp.]|nr:hypothetical protein [Stenotrophomonas sp.]